MIGRLCVVAAIALIVLIGWSNYIALFVSPACAWHQATIVTMDSSSGESEIVVIYRRDGAHDDIVVSDGFYARASVGQRVWVQQCQRGFGLVRDEEVSVAPHREGPGMPTQAND